VPRLVVGMNVPRRGLGVRLGTHSITCEVRRKLLLGTGTAIRWRIAGARYSRGRGWDGPHDKAPDVGPSSLTCRPMRNGVPAAASRRSDLLPEVPERARII
jgi:hypothetical protein